jgi:hypothetical protein
MNKQQLPQRPLEEVLRDPSANWQEIRSAIKGQGGTSACTNVAIMQALANERSWATAAVATAIFMKEGEQKDEEINLETDDCGNLENSGDLENNGDHLENSGGTNYDEIEVLTSPLPIANDIEESLSTENETDIKRSFRRSRGRRGSGIGTSFRRSGRRRGTRRRSSFKASSASVNIMDFGVIDTIFDLSDSNRTGSDNLRESGDFSDDISKSGFMGWKHHDDLSVRSSFTLDRSIQLDGSERDSIILSEGDIDDLKASFSNLVDSSGFLDWRHSSKRRTSSRSSTGDEDEGEGFLDWRHSMRRRPSVRKSFIDTVDEVDDELSCSNNETWNIEDYDCPDNFVHSSDYKPMSALTDRLKRFNSTRKVEVDRKKDITISDIKEALLAVRTVESGNTEQEQSTSHRPTISGVPDTATQTNHEVPTRKNRTRRQTVIGNVAMFGAMLKPVSKSNTKNNCESQEGNHLDSSIDGYESKKKAPNRRKTIMEGISPFVGMRKDPVEKTVDTPTHDDRKAIRISREDGNVDIERECRKLYGLRGDLDCFSSHSG